jgi:ribosomal protein S18 acetylase RimI-like enzyme
MHRKNRHTANLGIAIRAGHRHLGLGTRLIEEAKIEAMKRGIEKINLDVFSTNTVAIETYEKLGFRKEGARVGQFFFDGKYVDDILMTFYTSDIPSDLA